MNFIFTYIFIFKAKRYKFKNNFWKQTNKRLYFFTIKWKKTVYFENGWKKHFHIVINFKAVTLILIIFYLKKIS